LQFHHYVPFFGFDAADSIALENYRRRFNALDNVQLNPRRETENGQSNTLGDCVCPDLGYIVCGKFNPLLRDPDKSDAPHDAKSVAPLWTV
jgi:hypothetical protein